MLALIINFSKPSLTPSRLFLFNFRRYNMMKEKHLFFYTQILVWNSKLAAKLPPFTVCINLL